MKCQAGMVLIEVMVAPAVFALTDLVVMQSILQRMHQSGRMGEKTLVSWSADNQSMQLRPEEHWPALS